MNWELLLKKYMAHVGAAEGSTFTMDWHRQDSADSVEFTDEEWTTLMELDLTDVLID